MNASNHYFLFGSEQFSFRGSEKGEPVIGYDAVNEGNKENYAISFEAKDRRVESIDQRALELLAQNVVRHQLKTARYGAGEGSIAVTFKPPYDRMVTANDEKRTFILSSQEQDVFTTYLKNALLSIKEP